MRKSVGIFVFSLDTEIAWGTFDIGGMRLYRRHFDQYRDLVRRLLVLLDAYEIPVTWGFVGHLLLEQCRRVNGITHPEVLRPHYSWYPYDWHHCDPGTDVHRDPWWYGPDVLEMVLSARVKHEVGTHTFSHIIVDDPACTSEILRSQLTACVELHRRYGLEIHSIVFPRNRVAHLEVLPEFGIAAYRGQERRWYARLWPNTSGHGLLHILDRAMPFPPSTYSFAGLCNGPLVNLPASMLVLSRDGFRRYIPIKTRVLQAQAGLNRAAKRRELFHLWFHPFNLGSDPKLFTALEQILCTAYELRASGLLDILPMCQAAERIRQICSHGTHCCSRET